MRDSMFTKVLWNIPAYVAAIILVQTLYFKFTAQPESVYIFETLGMEPIGRIGSGIAELVAAILLIIPRTSLYGAFMSLGVISGAIFFHLTKLGIVIKDDGGTLFILAVVVFICSLLVVLREKKHLTSIIQRFSKK